MLFYFCISHSLIFAHIFLIFVLIYFYFRVKDDIILGPNGVLLFDFSRATTSPTHATELAGCDLRYISPEATGRTQHNVDNRSGTLCVVIYIL